MKTAIYECECDHFTVIRLQMSRLQEVKCSNCGRKWKQLFYTDECQTCKKEVERIAKKKQKCSGKECGRSTGYCHEVCCQSGKEKKEVQSEEEQKIARQQEGHTVDNHYPPLRDFI